MTAAITREPTASSRSGGFRAHLEGVKLHDLVLFQGLVRASGVFLVLSEGRSGSLHFFEGQIFHAETIDLSGDAAALEILSWGEGEFISSDRAVAEDTTVSSPLAALLRSVVSGPGAPEHDVSETSIHAPSGGEAGLNKTGVRRMQRHGVVDGASTGLSRGATDAPTPPTVLAAAATPGTAARTPRAAETRGVTHVLVSPHGELIDGHGADTSGLASRIAYVARLAELIGQAMGSGTTRCLKVRVAGNEMSLHRHADGHVSGSLGPVAR
jgi:hypothetical protein